MKVVIIQPHFLPFIGYFDLMNRADLFVYYDTVQFKRRSWHCRTYLTENGIARWLSVPVRAVQGSRRAIKEMFFDDDQPWRKKMAMRLQLNYAGCKEPNVLTMIIDLIQSGPDSLCEWNILANRTLSSLLSINTKSIRASELATVTGEKQERIIRLCQEFGATHYVCGPGSRSYVREEDFARVKIAVEWVNYNYQYRAQTSEGVEVIPSFLDLILRKGMRAACAMIRDQTSTDLSA